MGVLLLPLDSDTFVAIIRTTAQGRKDKHMTFAQKLRKLRDAAGLTETALANKAGLPFATVHAYGYGARQPTLANAVRLARALTVSVAVFEVTVPMTKRKRGRR
jgi:DNA-binding XRE family transcriptional regulator